MIGGGLSLRLKYCSQRPKRTAGPTTSGAGGIQRISSSGPNSYLCLIFAFSTSDFAAHSALVIFLIGALQGSRGENRCK